MLCHSSLHCLNIQLVQLWIDRAHSDKLHREGVTSAAHCNNNLPHVVWVIIIHSHECCFWLCYKSMSSLVATVKTLFFLTCSVAKIKVALKEYGDGNVRKCILQKSKSSGFSALFFRGLMWRCCKYLSEMTLKLCDWSNLNTIHEEGDWM